VTKSGGDGGMGFGSGTSFGKMFRHKGRKNVENEELSDESQLAA
jgi:hypothetical protein